MTETVDVSLSENQDTNPIPPSLPTSGRVAIPVAKRAYLEGFDENPGKVMPKDYDASAIGATYSVKSNKPFSTYTIYKFSVYEYNIWDDYKNAVQAGSLTPEVVSFELCFDVHMWSENTLNPDILRENEFEVTMRATKNCIIPWIY